MTSLRRLLPIIALCATFPAAAHGKGGREPFELVRALRAVQDEIIRGNSQAHVAQRTILTTMADQLAAVRPALWRESRNARAAALFVLSGGSPRVAKSALAAGGHASADEALLKGSLAYAEGRQVAAIALLSGIDPKALEPGIAGHVALVQATLVAKADPARAMLLLDEARLLAPGTLVEEAALRRQALLAAAAGDSARFDALSARYLHRYPASLYAAAFRRQLAVELAQAASADDAGQFRKIEMSLRSADPAEREEVLLAVAQEAVLGGRVRLARLAARDAGGAPGARGVTRARSGIYEGAALIVTDDYESGIARLRGVERTSLGPQDAELLDAALQVATAIRRMPDASEAASRPPSAQPASARARELAGAGHRVTALAQAAVAKVDAMMARTMK